MNLFCCYFGVLFVLCVCVWFFVCLFLFGFFVVFFFSRGRVSLYSPSCPVTHSVDQAGFELRNPPASASRVLGLKARAAAVQHKLIISSYSTFRSLAKDFRQGIRLLYLKRFSLHILWPYKLLHVAVVLLG